MSEADLLATLESLGHPRVLVLGDFILDLYTWGDADRISQEAPVILLRADRREKRLGGAGNVCQMLRGLEAHVACAGVVGDDDAGRHVVRTLEGMDVDCSLLLADERRPTTTKERFIGRAAGRHPHQMLRVDSETREPLSAEIEGRLLSQLNDCISQFDIVLVSDYAKGVCTPSLLRGVIDRARSLGVPVLVDPVKTRDYGVYRGATAITPNRNEAADASGKTINRPSDALEIGREFCGQYDFEMAIITLDRDGMALVRRDGTGRTLPTQPRAVYDITGAGDMVLATLGMCLASRTKPEDAVRLANVAGGLEVEHFGVAVIRRDEIASHLKAALQPAAAKVLQQAELMRRVHVCRERGQRVVFTNGCFDLLHVGHITYLHQAAALGDVLIIGVNSDDSVRRLKGPKRPVISELDRASMLAAIGCVDFVTVFDEDTPESLVGALRPDLIVKGGDYRPEQVVGGELVESYGGQIVILPLVDGVSTSHIIKTVAA